MIARVVQGQLALGAVLVLAACQQQTFASSIRTFNRPIEAAFVCLETETGIGRTLEDCTLDSSGASPTGVAMHALVLQQARGEVAAVDLVSRTVVDADPAVPGYSFVAVEPLPVAIVVPRISPTCAFVASAGADAVEAVDLRAFRRQSAPSAEEFEPFALPGTPAGMVLDPTELALWVAIPSRSSVVRVEIAECLFGASEEILLGATVPAPTVAAPIDDGAIARYCPLTFEAAPLPTLQPRNAELLDVAARPAVLAVGRELLIGDRALPLVHRIDLAARVALPPFSVGAPVRALAVTPEVPSSYDEATSIPERFVYGIDDSDGTVFALEYSDPASSEFGAVLPIGAGSSMRPDRMPFLVGARTLAVLSPLYDPLAPFERLCDPLNISDEEALPSLETLRGVFLAVGMTDATVRFVDVFDSDAPCRGRVEGVTEDCNNSSEPFVYIRRHHPRVGERRAIAGVVASDVSFIINGATVRLTETSAELEQAACPSPLRPIFAPNTDGSAARVCGHSDPYEAVPEVWAATWQGALLGTAATTGNFTTLDDGTVALDARVDFCASGVLGSTQALSAPAPEGELTGGDVVAITTTLTATMAADERCQAVIGIEGASQSSRPILLAIQRASTRPDDLHEPYRGRLVFAANTPILDRTTPDLTVADVMRCFGDELVRFDVRVRDSFSVIGARSGQRHRVVRGSDGGCEVDASRPVTWQSRARASTPFANDLIGFHVASRPTSDLTELRVTIGTVPATLNLDIGAASSTTSTARSLSLPTDLLWNDVYQRFYIVDVERRGLLETTMQPLRYTSTRFE